MAYQLTPIAHSEVGLVRKTNQDSGFVSGHLLFVADGMGGAAAGDLASAMATHEILTMTFAADGGRPAPDSLRDAVTQANTDLADLIARDPVLDGMGTTVCGGIFDGTTLTLVHIGDSRAYLLTGDNLQRLTHDHSYVQSLIDQGRLDSDAALAHPHRSLLLRVLNGQTDIEPDYLAVEVQAGDRLMLCSDGLCGLAPDSEILTAMSVPDINQAMTDLIELAHAGGGTDNITIILADVVDEELVVPLLPVTDPVTTIDSTPDDSDDDDDPLVKRTLIMDAATLAPLRQSLEKTGFDTSEVNAAGFVTSGLIGAAADRQLMTILDALRHLDPAKTGRHRSTRASSRGGSGTRAPRPRKLSSPSADPRLTPALLERQRYIPTAKRSHKGIWVLVLAVLAVLGGAGYGVYAYVSNQYFIAEYDGHVAIYQGLEGHIAGFDTSVLYEETTIRLTDLPISYRERVRGVIPIDGGLEQAQVTIGELRDKSEQCLDQRQSRPPETPPPADGC